MGWGGWGGMWKIGLGGVDPWSRVWWYERDDGKNDDIFHMKIIILFIKDS